MGNVNISPNLKKVSVRIDGSGRVVKSSIPRPERKLTREEEIAELEERLNLLKQ